MLAAPVPASGQAGLDLVEYQQDIELIAEPAERFQPFATKMIVAAFTLDRLDDDCGNIDGLAPENVAHLCFGPLFSFAHIFSAFRLRQREIEAWRHGPRPRKFGEIIRLARFRIGAAQGVAPAAIKSALGM